MVRYPWWSKQCHRGYYSRGPHVRPTALLEFNYENICNLLSTPRICWPFAADQPTNAARLSSVLDVAYELFEVRTGENGLKPLHRLGRAPIGTLDAVRDETRVVLEKAFGEDGARKRANLEKLQEVISGSWDEGWPAKKDMRRFVSTLGK